MDVCECVPAVYILRNTPTFILYNLAGFVLLHFELNLHENICVTIWQQQLQQQQWQLLPRPLTHTHTHTCPGPFCYICGFCWHKCCKVTNGYRDTMADTDTSTTHNHRTGAPAKSFHNENQYLCATQST